MSALENPRINRDGQKNVPASEGSKGVSRKIISVVVNPNSKIQPTKHALSIEFRFMGYQIRVQKSRRFLLYFLFLSISMVNINDDE